jgi:hypothetical protein
MDTRYDLRFLIAAILLLLGGITLGIVMGVREDFQLVAVHAHINLVGWVSLALFGLVYRAYPELAGNRLAPIHFWLSLTAAVLFPVGIGLSILYHWPLLAIVGSFIWAGACVTFLLQLLSLVREDNPRVAQPAE